MLQTETDDNYGNDKKDSKNGIDDENDLDNDEDERMLEDMMDVEFDGILQVEQPTANGPSSSPPPPSSSHPPPLSSSSFPPIAKAPMFQLQSQTNTTSTFDSNSAPVLEWDDVAVIRCFELALSSHDARLSKKPTGMDDGDDDDDDDDNDWVFRPLPLPQSRPPSTTIAGHDESHARDDGVDENDKTGGEESKNFQKECGKWTPSALPMPEWVIDPVYDLRRLTSQRNVSCQPNSL